MPEPEEVDLSQEEIIAMFDEADPGGAWDEDEYDFYEEDEPVEDVVAAYDSAPPEDRGITSGPEAS